MATTEIPAESVYVSVPERVIIDEETARASALGPLFGELDVELRGSRGSPLGQFEVIRLFLLAELSPRKIPSTLYSNDLSKS